MSPVVKLLYEWYLSDKTDTIWYLKTCYMDGEDFVVIFSFDGLEIKDRLTPNEGPK